MNAITILHRILPTSFPVIHAKRLANLLPAVEAVVTGSRLTLNDMERGLIGPVAVKHNNKAPRRKQRGINTALQAVGFQPAFAPRGGELNPERLNALIGCWAKAGEQAHRLRIKFHRPLKLVEGNVLLEVVNKHLKKKWSPEQIAGTLKRMHPDQSVQRVSHKTIFYAMPRGELRRELIASLRWIGA